MGCGWSVHAQDSCMHATPSHCALAGSKQTMERAQCPPARGGPCQRRPACGTGSARPASPSPRLHANNNTQRMQQQTLDHKSATQDRLVQHQDTFPSFPMKEQSRAPRKTEINPTRHTQNPANAPTMARCASLRSSMRYHSMRCRPSGSSSFSWLHTKQGGQIQCLRTTEKYTCNKASPPQLAAPRVSSVAPNTPHHSPPSHPTKNQYPAHHTCGPQTWGAESGLGLRAPHPSPGGCAPPPAPCCAL